MSISITINDINNLTDTERAVLRLVADNSVATSLQRTVRDMGASYEQQAGRTVRALHNHTTEAPLEATVTTDEAGVQTVTATIPREPDEVVSPHTIVQTVDATVPATPASAELDSKGLPWDKRIHSSSRAKVADGSWRKFRGVDDALVAQVEAELRGVQAAPSIRHVDGNIHNNDLSNVIASVTPPSAPAGWPFGTGTPEQQDATAAAQDVAPAAPVPVPPVPVAAVPTPPSDAPMTFATMMQRITPNIVSGALSQARIQEVCAQLQLPHLAALGARPDLIPAALAALESGVAV